MDAPLDYTSAFPSQTPTQSLAQGYQLGTGIRDDFQQQAALQQAQQQQVAQNQALASLTSNPNAGAKDYAAASLLFPKLREQVNQAWTMQNTAQKQSQLSSMSQAFAAIKSGQPDIAVKQLQDSATAGENSGQMPAQEVQARRTMAQAIAMHPESALTTIGIHLGALGEDGARVLSGATTLGTEQRAQAQAPADLALKNANAGKAAAELPYVAPKAEADINNINSQIGERTAQVKNLSDRLSLDQDKLQSEVQQKLMEFKAKQGELPEYVAKSVGEATTNAVAAQQSAGKMLDLATQIDSQAENMPSGIKAKQYELVKQGLGWQNEISRLRSEYSRIVTPAALAAYKQVASGSTSDKDIETAMVGVPKDTDPPERMASFLRGAAKIQQYNSALENAKSEWLAANKFLGKATQDLEVDGIKVPKGNSFKDFSDKYISQKVGQLQGQSVVNDLAKKYSGGASGGY